MGLIMTSVSRRARELETVFREEFAGEYNTLLVGGADEPLYLPAADELSCHQLFYREDYYSSALHEIAHWCIAGEKRRKATDFGYWYNPDGRTRKQQRAFEQVEIKPQAIEWVFSTAAGIPFNVSADNISSADPEVSAPSRGFLLAVEKQALDYCQHGLPPRAERFARAVQRFYESPEPLDAALYKGRFSS